MKKQATTKKKTTKKASTTKKVSTTKASTKSSTEKSTTKKKIPAPSKKKPAKIIYLIRQYYRIQEHRTAFGNQISALKEAKMDAKQLENYFNILYGMENDIKKDLTLIVNKDEVWGNFLKDVKGIGPVIGAGILNLVDIKKARHVSSLWKFAGMDVQGGQAPKRKKGEKTCWNPLMRTLCWKIGKSFLMSDSPYKKVYEKRKKYEARKHKDLTKMHIHNRSCRFMTKRFLSDLWVNWRQIKGLPVTAPYCIEKLGHRYDKTETIKTKKERR